MAFKFLAVQGLTLTPQGIVSGGIKTISSVASVNVKADGKGCYKSPLTFTVAGANATGYDPGTVATVSPCSINATAVASKVDGGFAMRVDDQASASMTGTIGGTPTPFVEVFKITDAGQSKVRGN